jgi:DnaJ-class molecular chaperone
VARKDYYLILGVSRGENLRSIQEAFRELAKRHHPDRAGPQGTSRFQEIQEAYSVLSDPERRRWHNHELEQEEIKARSYLGSQTMSVLHDFATVRPSYEPLFERFLRNFTGKGIPKGERLEPLNVELTLPPEEAARTVAVPVSVPVFSICRQCGGSGRDWLYPCVRCNGQGIIEEEKMVRIRIPRMVPDRTVFDVPIHGLGIHNFYLRLHTRISR